MIATSRIAVFSRFAVDGDRNVFVREQVLVLRRVRQRLDDKPHGHPVLENAVLDRALRTNERENARTFVEIDEGLEERNLKSFRCNARDRMTEEPALLPDLR